MLGLKKSKKTVPFGLIFYSLHVHFVFNDESVSLKVCLSDMTNFVDDKLKVKDHLHFFSKIGKADNKITFENEAEFA